MRPWTLRRIATRILENPRRIPFGFVRRPTRSTTTPVGPGLRDRLLGHAQGLVADEDLVARVQLAPAPALELAVDPHLCRREQQLGLAARADDARELEQLAEPDHLAADRHLPHAVLSSSMTPRISRTRQTSSRSSSTSTQTPAERGNTTWSPGLTGILKSGRSGGPSPAASTMPSLGGT